MVSLVTKGLALTRTGIRPMCECGKPVRSKGRTVSGIRIWDRKCSVCRWGTYTRFKKDYCEACGFKAVHRVQLDVDHIDGNHMNNDIDNLQTLCANCHRLKTQTNSDHMPMRGEVVMINDMQLELRLDA
jgi:5-methylcytosine-specific restriction endonuclease McrA